MNNNIVKNMYKHNINLSVYACSDDAAIRLYKIDSDFRPPYFRDIVIILHTIHKQNTSIYKC